MAHSSRLTLSASAARAAAAVVDDDDNLDEEPGEEIESAPPLRVGEEREIGGAGLRKKLLRPGRGWETPVLGDEVTVHYEGRLLDGRKFESTRDRGEPLTFELGGEQGIAGLDQGIITMKRGELALFTLPCSSGYRHAAAQGVPPDADMQFEVELLSWLTVMDICKDGGIVKKVLSGGDDRQTGDLDEVTVKYQVRLLDGTIVAETPEGGFEFCVNQGHLCPALPKIVNTMRRGEKAFVTIQPQYAFGEAGREAINGLPAIPSNAVLNIEVELVSLKPVVDVTGDMKVLKKILRAGEGLRTPNSGETVCVRYTAMFKGGTTFEKVGFDGESFQFIIDEEQVIAGLDRAVSTMLKGELSELTIEPEYAFGNDEAKRDVTIIPSSSTLIYVVELLDFTKEKDIREMTGLEKIQAAEGTKSSGNDLFKNGKFERAAKKYDKAARYIDGEGTFEDNEEKLVKSLRISCWLNSAACCLKLKDFQGAIRLCSQVLDNEFCNVKALYRRAQAYIEAADLDLAKLDIQKALELDPKNKEMKSLQMTLKQLQAEKNRRDAKLYANMFQWTRKDADVMVKKLKVGKPQGDEREGSAEVEASNLENYMRCERKVAEKEVKCDRETQAMEVVDATCAGDREMADSVGR
uniref:peptidylprolyl isomerase n=1 Tax=Musa acuminata subsp. malaccensis TaxID=214687 RepID=A0A804K2Z0_MUSAM|nr:PREDICTED: 70 kDa peptidyl-prolyl isomerase-like isoform X1 [Musa acuminata subsp. malaccensis]XP_018685326.1 PREDICTED: 70 kDa peptidyl-prolyl isomerase-like isoform X1 [Musa acuminata subsp. malaccensis]